MPAESSNLLFDISWLAVRGAPAEAFVKALDLADLVQVPLRQGVNAVCGDYWDPSSLELPQLSRVYITPELDGWRLAVGGWLGGQGFKNTDNDIAGLCTQLSREFGEACAFTTQSRMDWYSWCLARAGAILRHFVWDDGQAVIDRGNPSNAERQSREEFGDDEGVEDEEEWSPDERIVFAIAKEFTLDLDRLGSAKTLEMGLLAATSSGRENGVPTRPLED